MGESLSAARGIKGGRDPKPVVDEGRTGDSPGIEREEFWVRSVSPQAWGNCTSKGGERKGTNGVVSRGLKT